MVATEIVDNVRNGLREIGELTADQNLTRGVMIVAATVIGTLLWLFRRKSPTRTRVWVDAPAGEKVFVQTGEDEDSAETA